MKETMKIIDVHCHILPGLDDGAADIRESQKMLRMAYDQGICSVIATPHYSIQFQNNTPELIRKKCDELQEWATRELDEKFHIYPGQEIFSFHHVVEKLDQGKLLSLAGSSCVLLEFLPSVSFSSLYKTVRELTMTPYRPILAHIERYQELRKKEKVEELIETGALMQMNYRPIGGKWYGDTTRWCRKMLLEGNIHFLGTDMHDTEQRYPETEEAMLWMEKNLDEEYINEICWKNAEKFILDVEIDRK